MPARFIVSEYNLLWEALKFYRQHLAQVSKNSVDEDEQVFVDENLVKLNGIFKDVQAAAKQDWDLDLK
ncbi:hypothetical protein [Mitsuaria sp. 7]|uniref:hypothetical protein n=1 Tax=Mitsuaria sp. 7 TaxID=1658665 RepID=UPI0007DD17B5|nr:hypothetical protein [Mitsuaria sp. 7]ANH67578.1 hypothetical protein ABE85_08370 [Mitsuaria sp. 7]